MRYGMIGWYVPLERFPDTYNGQPLALAGLASQKSYVSLYLNSVYGDVETEAWLKERRRFLDALPRGSRIVASDPGSATRLTHGRPMPRAGWPP
jgi:hypothetical protein